MKIEKYPDSHLTYCSNIHPGESWTDHFAQLKAYLPALKKRISPVNPFGVGLRLSADAANELLMPDKLDAFKEWLENEGLYVFTINGFPYGSFHGERVKDNVYKPDWSTKERFEYTLSLIRILSTLLPAGIDGGISTSPISYKFWYKHIYDYDQIFRESTIHLAEIAHELSQIMAKRKKELHLDIEPEPDCLLENSRETVSFYTNWLFPAGSEHLMKTYGYRKDEALHILKNHIRVCYDTCHFALEFEEPKDAIDRLITAGIRIGKTQISAALKVNLGYGESRRSIASKLKKFDEPVYLHQVIEWRSNGSYKQYRDLPIALRNIDNPLAQEWRVHFHVPVFVDQFEEMESTQGHILEGLKPLLEESGCRHFEIETYTWEVLPDYLKAEITDSIEREYRWTLNLINTF